MKRNKYIITILLSLYFLQGCKNSVTQNTEEHPVESGRSEVRFSEKEMETAELLLVKAEQKSMSSSIHVNGILHAPPQSLISVSAPMAGFVVETDLLPGMKVKKGQVLAILEHQDYVQLQEEFLSASSHLKYLKAEYERQLLLQNEQVNSRKAFELAETNYLEMKVKVYSLREKLALIGINAGQLSIEGISRKITVSSPISGYVSAVGVNIGKYVQPADVLFEIVNTEHLHAELTVYEKDVAKIRVGQKVEFELPNNSTDLRMASIYLIGRSIDEDRAVRVHAHLEKEDTDLIPGMYISARIFTSDHTNWTLPEEAVIMESGKFFVFCLVSSAEDTFTFEKWEVNKGVSYGGFTQVEFPDHINPEGLEFAGKGAFSLHSKMNNSEAEGHGH